MTTQEILQGVHDWTNGKIVYDISVAHPDGQGNPTKYANLTAALGTGGANIPEALRKGGMSVKFVLSSDNKYLQYRLMSDTFSTTESDWQGVDEEIKAGSHNLAESGDVYNNFQSVSRQITGEINPFLTLGTLNTSKPYAEQNSNYALRTGFLEFPLNGKVEVNSPYTATYYYYDAQKAGLNRSTTFYPTNSACKYFRIVVTGGSGKADAWENIGLEVTYTGSLSDRISIVEKNANYSQYDVLLEQGGFIFSTGDVTDSQKYVRTRYLTYNFIGKVAIGSGYTVRAFYYGQNKSYISNAALSFTDGVCELPEVQNAVYVAFAVALSGGGAILPSDVTSMRLYPKSQESEESQYDPIEILRSSALVPILNQGALSFVGGLEIDSAKYVRTPYIPYHSFYKVLVNSGYVVRMFKYSDLGEYINYDSIDASQGYVLPYSENIKYLRFAIQKEDTSATIIPTDPIGLKLFGFNDYREEEADKENTRDFIRLNADNLPILAGCFTQRNYIGFTNFCAFAVTDLHGRFTSVEDTKKAIQYVRANILPTKTIACLCCGDICTGTPKTDGVVSSDIAPYMAYAEEMGIYHTMGQHEVGFPNTEPTGRAKNNCFTHQEVFDTFISPMKTIWGLPNLDTIYYYKDFADSNTRLISLYQYNIPLVDDPSDSSLYKYQRMVVWYGQEQINWLIQTLNSTPSNYTVIILMHEPEGVILPTPKKLFFTGSSIIGGSLIINGTPIYDIVAAYVAKTTLTQSYTCNDKTTYSVEDFTLSVNADFSQASGNFACFMTGDSHVDYMGVIENTSLINIGMTATSNVSYDLTIYQETRGKMKWLGNNVASSIVTCLGLCYGNRLIKVGRLGQQYANNGDFRNYGSITY